MFEGSRSHTASCLVSFQEVSWKLWSLPPDKNPDNAGDWTEVLSVQGEFGNEVTSNTVDVAPNVTFHFKIDDIGEGRFVSLSMQQCFGQSFDHTSLNLYFAFLRPHLQMAFVAGTAMGL